MMQVKVCGMRSPQNISDLLDLPIDFIGLIFYEKSKRFVGKDNALSEWIIEHEEDFGLAKKVGVFVNAGIDQILNNTHDFHLDYVQLHGEESPEYCQELRLLWSASSVRKAKLVKAFSIDEKFDFARVEPYEAHCSFFVFDTKGADYGGNGTQFDWDLLDAYQGSTPFLLSGGIDLESSEAIRKLEHPMLFGVDINSKFESEPGIKDISTVAEFVTAVKKF
jgi:phosphoribosylanthranilate isomerase